ncbi:MAG: hypothetical protein ACYCYM_01475 [Saccharofermentanales bacterium]
MKEKQVVKRELFGANMEPTRLTFWDGVSAQMLNNRKFFSGDGQSISGWQLSGDASYCQNTADSCCASRYPVLRSGTLSQTSIMLTAVEGRSYIAGLWIRAARPTSLTLIWGEACRIRWDVDAEASVVHLEHTFEALEGGSLPMTLSVCGEAAIYVISLLPSDHMAGMRRDVLDMLRQVGPAELRFPGGCYAEAYHWKDGLLPVDQRPPVSSDLYDGDFLQRNTYGQDCHEVGTDEFMLLCEYVGARPVLTVPIICQSVADAADWVEYCNGTQDTVWGALRIRHGHAAPYAVRDWYIGNEVYYFGQKLAEDGALAAEVTNAFIAAMKEVDPSLRAIVGFCPHRPEWSRAYLPLVSETADMLSHHFYLTSEFSPNFGQLSAEDCMDVIPRDFLRELQGAYTMSSELSGHRWRFSLDEWGYDWGNRGHTRSASVDALILNFLIGHAWEYGIEKALYFHPVNEGLLKVDPASVELDLTGEVFQLFQAHCGAAVCLTETDDDHVSCAASIQEDGRLAVTLINRDLAETRKIAVDLSPIGRSNADGICHLLVPPFIGEDCSVYHKIDSAFNTKEDLLLPPGAVALLILLPSESGCR